MVMDCGNMTLPQSIKLKGTTTLSHRQTDGRTICTQFRSLISFSVFPILLNHKLNQVPQCNDLADQEQHAQQVPSEAPPPLPLPRRRLEPLVDLANVLPIVRQLPCHRVQLCVLLLDTLWVLEEWGGREGGRTRGG